MRLIDATPLECQAKEGMGNEWNHRAAPTSWAHAEERFLNRIEDAPTVDAVPVVRCKDCKWFADNNDGEWYGCQMFQVVLSTPEDAPKPDDFCSYGERKENDHEKV